MQINGRTRTAAVFAALLATMTWSCTGSAGKDGLNGTDGTNGANGKDGTNGADGTNGVDGKDGQNGFGLSTGIILTVNAVTVAADGTVTVDYTMKDDQGAAVDHNGVYTLGAAKPRFGLGKLEAAGKPYTTLTRSGSNSPTMLNTANANTGTVTEVTAKSGHYNYVFPAKYAAMAAGGADAGKTHTVFVQISRQLDLFDPATRYVANVTYDFLPSGTGSPPLAREVVKTLNCNQCHDPLAIHGGGRRDVKLCGVCHNPDLGAFDLPYFTHAIHSAQNLGSAGDFSEVTYPERLADCTVCHAGATQGNNFNTNPTAGACTGCHNYLKFDGTGAATCNVNGGWGGPACNHVGTVTATTACAPCHDSTYILNKHAEPAQYWNLLNSPPNKVDPSGKDPVVTTKIEAVNIVKNDADGKYYPTITFSIWTSFGGAERQPRNLLTNPLQTLRFLYGMSPAGATRVEYVRNGTLRVPTPAGHTAGWMGLDPPLPVEVTAGTPGKYTWTSPTALAVNDGLNPAGTYTGADTVAFAIDTAEGDEFTPWEVEVKGITSAVFFWRLDNANSGSNKPITRRVVVDGAKCVACHNAKEFGFHHAGSRNNVQECAICHDARTTDQRTTRLAPATGVTVPERRWDQSIQFSVMIHKMHTGAASADPFNWKYYSNSGVALERATYPGERVDCAQCHVTPSSPTSSTWGLPLNAAVWPTTTSKWYDCAAGTDPGYAGCTQVGADVVTPKTTAVCGSCHDSAAAAAHMTQNQVGTPPVETCDLCHGLYKDADVRKVHVKVP